MITYWHRLATLDDDSLLQKAYNEILTIPDELSDWKNTIKYILKLLGLDNLFDRPSSFSTAQVKRKVKDKLRSTFIHQWKKQISEASPESAKHSKLRYYKLFTTSFQTAKYLKTLKSFRLRQAMTKFRCSDHNLCIETGRHRNIKLEDRLCTKCDDHVLEDEIHFLLDCKAYKEIREKCFNSKIKDIINLDIERNTLFGQLLSLDEEDDISALANYISEATKKRTEMTEAAPHST